MPTQPKVSKGPPNKIRLGPGRFVVPVAIPWLVLAAGCKTPSADGPIRSTPPTPPPATFVAVPPPATKPAADPVIATVGPTRVHQAELQSALSEAYGFNLLMLIVQRDMARDACAEQHITVLPADIDAEYDFTVGKMFPDLGPQDDREKLLDQYLAQPKPRDQTATRTEFKIIIETNAYLRKLVQPSITQSVTDDMLQQQFDEEYGAQVRVRDLVVANPQEAAERRAQLDAGADFAALCRQYSRDPNTRRLGGELPPFTLNSTKLPANFKQMAFSLKPGEISDPVQAAGGYHLIKLEQKIAPRAVKFADVKESLRQDYEAKLVLEGVKGIRGKFAQQALTQLAISDPILKAEFDNRLKTRDQLVRDREKIRQDLERDRMNARQPATKPTTAATTPTTTTTTTTPTTTAPATAATRTPPPRPVPVTTPTPTTKPATVPVAVPPPVVKPPVATQPAAAPVVPPPVPTPAPMPPPATQPAAVRSTSPAVPPPVSAAPPAVVMPSTPPATRPAATSPPATAATPVAPATPGPTTRP